MSEQPGRTALYRIFGSADLLLYVGVSKDFGRRWNEHAKVQPWWGEMQRQTVEWCESRPDAEAAEEVAIKTEKPKFNIVHSVTVPPRPRRSSVKPRTLPALPIDKLAALPPAFDVVTAGRAFGLGRTKSYELARTDEFPCAVLTLGKQYRVTKADLLGALGLDLDGKPAHAAQGAA